MTTSPGNQQPAVTGRSRPIPKVLVGQKALVTGANSGIGRAVAVALGQAGADVVVNYVVGEEAAEHVVGEIRKCGSKAYAQKALRAQCEPVAERLSYVKACVFKLERNRKYLIRFESTDSFQTVQ